MLLSFSLVFCNYRWSIVASASRRTDLSNLALYEISARYTFIYSRKKINVKADSLQVQDLLFLQEYLLAQ